ncbi:MAG: DNA-directed RNA polymerase subunit A' [Nanobdellota archaeon]
MENEENHEGRSYEDWLEDTGNFVHKMVDSIEFGFLSPKMIKKMSVVKVVTPELYDKEGYPVDGGLMDLRMGVIDPGLRCKTDGSKVKDSLGYFGYIELARPVVHIKFVGLVQSVLRSTCRECGRVLMDDDKLKKTLKSIEKVRDEKGYDDYRAEVKKIMNSLKAVKKCPHCKADQGKIEVDKPSTFLEDDKRIFPIEIRARLEKIPDDDYKVLGINPESMRLEWAVLTVLPIPPVTMRTSITLESGERSEDDLTHKLGDVVRINQRLFENINAGAPEIIIEDLWDLLQYHVTTLFDNAVAQLPPARHRSGQPLKTISERIKSKEGRIRHNLAGKRTNFSARTVISPDPRIMVNEIGVPKEIAMKLTVPERINDWNTEYLKEYIEKGPKEYPGANYVIRPDGKKKKITDETKEQVLEEIQPGYIVERHLLDGDISIFNRQPSLHRMSMMCHRVKVLPGKTFRLNPAVCNPYNADFDGDEMNLHIPQTEEARAESEILMEVQTQLVTPKVGLTVFGCIQDAISGNYLLTKDLELSREEAIDLLFAVGETNFSKLKGERISGKDVFSALLPDDFTFYGNSKAKDTNGSDEVAIKKGKLEKGVMDKANLGEGSGLMLRNFQSRYGQDETMVFLGKLFRLGTEVITRYGFTAAISDSDLPQHAIDEINKVLSDAYKESEDLIKNFREGGLEPFPGRSEAETLELKLLELLNKARDNTGDIVTKYADQGSHTMIMAKSGGRGNLLNLAQMAACVGQQSLRGGRVDKGYKDRTLSCFKRNELMPEARGFIRNSFKYGLNPKEFFFMGMTARDSLMDTALRTPKSGYLYRRLANSLQDLKVEYDHTVRDTSKNVIQFAYGDDNVDVSRSEKGIINVKRIIKNEMNS